MLCIVEWNILSWKEPDSEMISKLLERLNICERTYLYLHSKLRTYIALLCMRSSSFTDRRDYETFS